MRNSLRFVTGNILVFAVSDLLGNFGRSMVFPYASLFILALGGNAAQIGLIAFVGQLAGLVLLPMAGYITDHSNRIQIIVLAGFSASAFMLLIVAAPNWQIVALASLLIGTIVFQFPAYASLIADSLSPENRGRGIGALNTISSSMAIFAPYIAGIVIESRGNEMGLRILYAGMLGLNLIATVIQMRYLKEPTTVQRTPLQVSALFNALVQAYRGIPKLIRQMPRSLKALTWVVILSFMSNAMMGSFWVVYAIDQIGLSAAEWGIILLIESVVKVLLFLPAGLIVDRRGRTGALIFALVISTLVTPLFISFSGFAMVLFVRLVLAVAFVLAIPACMALMADLIPAAVRGQMMAAIGQGGIIVGMVGTPGGPAVGYLIIPFMMAASIAGGLLYLVNPAAPWIFATIAGAVSVIITVLFVRDAQTAEL